MNCMHLPPTTISVPALTLLSVTDSPPRTSLVITVFPPLLRLYHAWTGMRGPPAPYWMADPTQRIVALQSSLGVISPLLVPKSTGSDGGTGVSVPGPMPAGGPDPP